MEMKINILKFDATAKKVGISIEIEELNEKYLPELLSIVREGKIQNIRFTDCDPVEE